MKLYQTNLIKFFEEHRVDTDALISTVFDGYKSPEHAFWRVSTGRTKVTADVLAKIATFCGVHPGDLFDVMGADILDASGEAEPGSLVLVLGGEFTVEYYPREQIGLLHNRKSDFCKEFDVPADITLSQFITLALTEVQSYNR